MQSPNFPGLFDASAVLMMSIDKCVDEAHHHDPTPEASQEHLGDQVMEKMVSSWEHSSLSPKRSKYIIQTRAFVVMREREPGSVRASNRAHLVHDPQCEIFEPCKARCRECEERQQLSPGRETRDTSFMCRRMSATR